MRRRPTGPPEAPPPAALTMSRREADTKIAARLEKGQELVRSWGPLTRGEGDRAQFTHGYDGWNRYNVDMLTRMFTDSSVAQEYESAGPPVAVLELEGPFGSPNPLAELNRQAGKLDAQIRMLQLLRERLELFEEPPAVETKTAAGDPGAVSAAPTPVVDAQERRLLLAVFINSAASADQRLNIHRFCMKHKRDIPIIDRLLERKLVAQERDLYRLTLNGIYAADHDGPREYIRSFNSVLPVLDSMYEEGEGKSWSMREFFERAHRWPNLAIDENALGRAFWCITPNVPVFGGWSHGGPGELASFSLTRTVVNFSPLPLEKDLSVPDDTELRAELLLEDLSGTRTHAPIIDPELVDALQTIGEQLAACYRQAFRDIEQLDRESFVGPAAALRELVTAVLKHRAPDAEVAAQAGFKPEADHGRPSRAQRVRYILSTRASGVSTESIDRALEGLDAIVRDTYDRASKATHLGETGRKEIVTLATYVRGILRDLLLH